MSSQATSLDSALPEPVAIGDLASRPLGQGGFRARFADGQEITTGYRPADRAAGKAPADPIEQARADAFAEGFEAGVRVTGEANADENGARERLARALELLAPAQSGALSSMLTTAVLRLVEQIVGVAPVDVDLLRSRAQAVAVFVEGEQGRHGLHVHPDDLPLLEGSDLGVPLIPDAAMSRGSIRLDTSDGWIEDGPDIQISRLKALFEDMEGRA